MTDAHAGLVNDVALKQGMLAMSSKARSNYPQFVTWRATFATFVQCFFPCGWRHNLLLDGSGGKAVPVQPNPEAGGALPGDGCQRPGADGRVRVRLDP